jgi:DNA-directed RNA polymerase subunit RPC12/RpoP
MDSSKEIILNYQYLCMGCKDKMVILHHSQYFRTVYCDDCLDKPEEYAV